MVLIRKELIGLSVCLLCLVAAAEGDNAPFTDRVVHRFDFDERDDGNLEDIPKYWLPLRLPSFPGYTKGGFDQDVGRSAAPSFHLQSNGRNVAYRYSGPETWTRVGTDYRIEAHIRPDGLRHARACISACFLDEDAKPILDSLAHSRFIGGPRDAKDWHVVNLQLADAPPEARTIGLYAWVLQENIWQTAPVVRRHIAHTDVHAGAWFDDVTIFSLPTAAVRTTAAGNVLVEPGPTFVEAVVSDSVKTGLGGRLMIIAADGSVVEFHDIPAVIDEKPTQIDLAHLSPGLYQAKLIVLAGQKEIAHRQLTFVRLREFDDSEVLASRSFGIVLNAAQRAHPGVELDILRHQSVGSVKVPVWTGLAEDPPSVIYQDATHDLLHGLFREGVELTAVLAGPPSQTVRTSGAYPRSLLELLAGDPSAWRESLASVVAPFAGIFRWWQIGPDGAATPVDGKQLDIAADQVRSAMRQFISMPVLAAPYPSRWIPGDKRLSVEQLALTLEAGLHESAVLDQLQRLQRWGYENVTVVVEPQSSSRYERLSRLALWSRSMLLARHEGSGVVFAPQTWRVHDSKGADSIEPSEEFVLLRTMAQTVGDAQPGPRFRYDDSVHLLTFHDGKHSVLAAWDEDASESGRPFAIQLGDADHQLDLWGNVQTLEADDLGRHILQLSRLPILVPNVDRRLMDFRAGVSLTPDQVISGGERQRHVLEFSNESNLGISGEVRLDVPESWKSAPSHLQFDLMPFRKSTHELEFTYPHSAPARKEVVSAQINLSNPNLFMEVPLPVSVGLPDVEVWGSAVLVGEDLVLRHVVTNHSDETLHFRASANAPGRQRQYRPMINLQPGDTQAAEYRFLASSALIGTSVRLMLREMNDGPRTHSLELVVP